MKFKVGAIFSAWLIVAGISAIVTVVCLSFFSLFAILHVAMQLQRKEIMVSFSRAIFLKVVAAAISGDISGHYFIENLKYKKFKTFKIQNT
jgi:hypothetical protein